MHLWSRPFDSETAWKQFVARDPKARFVYGVTTTGVFCRPGCASRRPLRENVRFLETVVVPQAAGFRACKRCCPANLACAGGTLDKIRGHIEKKSRPYCAPERTWPRRRAGALYRATALQEGDGREPIVRSTRDACGTAARSVEARRKRDGCYLYSWVWIVEPRLRRKPIGHDAGTVCARR